MARRKDHTREELIKLAIDSARELVEAEGIHALTARNVAKSMGYTPGTLYNLFDNIDGLTTAINTSSLEAFAEELRLILRDYAKPKKRIRKISRAYLNFKKERPDLWTLLFATPIKHKSGDYRNAVYAVFSQVTEALLPISGSPKAARQDAKILWSTLHGICLLRQTGKLNVEETDTSEVLVKRFLDQFLKL